MGKISDLSLIAQVVMFDNKRAFDSLVKEYQSRVRKFFLAQTLGDEPLSDDLAQETFVKAYLKLSSFRGTSSFSTWLFRIAYNVYYDYTRSRHTTSDIDAAQAMPAEGASDTALQMDLYNALALLSDVQRTCITMQLIDGRSISDISSITDINEGTVKSHISRGKHVMTEYLKSNGYGR
ncbi:MAG: RNA polymerase sigma factor [Prevotella sp.]